MKLDKLSILKKIVKRIPLPDIKEPKLEELRYPEARSLYKMMVCSDYCFAVEDTCASKEVATRHGTEESSTKKEFDALEYKKIFRNAMKFLVHLAEADSFYRHRIAYFMFFAKNDVFRERFFDMLVEKGFDKKWDPSDGVIDMRAQMGQEDSKSLFSHIKFKKKEHIKTEEF